MTWRPAALTGRGSPTIERAGWTLSYVGPGDDCTSGFCRRPCSVAGEQLWTSGVDVCGEVDGPYCRRCAFVTVRHLNLKWEASFQRQRPWVGVDLQVWRSVVGKSHGARRRINRRYDRIRGCRL